MFGIVVQHKPIHIPEEFLGIVVYLLLDIPMSMVHRVASSPAIGAVRQVGIRQLFSQDFLLCSWSIRGEYNFCKPIPIALIEGESGTAQPQQLVTLQRLESLYQRFDMETFGYGGKFLHRDLKVIEDALVPACQDSQPIGSGIPEIRILFEFKKRFHDRTDQILLVFLAQ